MKRIRVANLRHVVEFARAGGKEIQAVTGFAWRNWAIVILRRVKP